MNPQVTVRLNNGHQVADKYTVDVEFSADNQIVFGGNFRFWFDAHNFSKWAKFKGFKQGYGTHPPTSMVGMSPVVSIPRSIINWFDFIGDACYVEGSFELKDKTKGILLTAGNWVSLFQIELTALGTVLNPPIVLDLEKDPANGGFLNGSDGIVLSVISGNITTYVDERVSQFNWAYSQSGVPYGHPTN